MDVALRAFGAYPQLLGRRDAPRKSGNAAGVDRRGLTPHLMRDIGLVDFADGRSHRDGLANLIGRLPPRL